MDTFRGPVENVVNGGGSAGVALVLGLGVALLSASGYVGAFMRASNAIYEVEEGRAVLEAPAAPGAGRRS